jgi:cytochrome b561
MQVRNSAERYGFVTQTIHWLTVVLVLAAWASGMFGEDLLKDVIGERAILSLHLYAGLSVVVLLVLRLAWQIGNPTPLPEPTPLGVWGDRIAKLTHAIIYILLIAVPITGIAAQFARGRALPVFGLFEISSPWTPDRAFIRSVTEVHETIANVLLVVALLHAGAALFHHWVLRDRTLDRMLPGR